MANHKRRKQPNRRAGCKMCKPQKAVAGYKGKVDREVMGRGGFGKIRSLRSAAQDQAEYLGAALG